MYKLYIIALENDNNIPKFMAGKCYQTFKGVKQVQDIMKRSSSGKKHDKILINMSRKINKIFTLNMIL